MTNRGLKTKIKVELQIVYPDEITHLDLHYLHIANSVDPDHLALHRLSLSMQICINNLDQKI